MITKLEEILQLAQNGEKSILAVAAAQDEEVLTAIKSAVEIDIINPILVGDKKEIQRIANDIELDLNDIKIIDSCDLKESAEIAIKLVSNNEADFVMKGILDTSILLKAVLNKEFGLRTNSLLSHVMLYSISNYHKLLILTDGGMNINPSYEDKVKILKNAIEATKPLGLEKIKVACLSAKEKVNPKMLSTVDAGLLVDIAKNGEFGDDIVVEGPLAFDLAISKEASLIKKFKSEVSGDVDILLVPTIEVGNALGKSFTYIGKSSSAGVIMGAKAPVVLTSRADTAETKLYSIAYGAIIAKNNKIRTN